MPSDLDASLRADIKLPEVAMLLTGDGRGLRAASASTLICSGFTIMVGD